MSDNLGCARVKTRPIQYNNDVSRGLHAGSGVGGAARTLVCHQLITHGISGEQGPRADFAFKPIDCHSSSPRPATHQNLTETNPPPLESYRRHRRTYLNAPCKSTSTILALRSSLTISQSLLFHIVYFIRVCRGTHLSILTRGRQAASIRKQLEIFRIFDLLSLSQNKLNTLSYHYF